MEGPTIVACVVSRGTLRSAAVAAIVTVGASLAQPFSGASEDVAYVGILVVTVLLMRRAWRSPVAPDGRGGPEAPGPLDGHHGGFGGHGGGHF